MNVCSAEEKKVSNAALRSGERQKASIACIASAFYLNQREKMYCQYRSFASQAPTFAFFLSK